MNRCITYLLLILTYIPHIYAQREIDIVKEFNHNNLITNKIINKTSKSYNEIEGSPYLNEMFVKGEVLKRSGEKHINIPLRYNIFTDEIEFKRDNTILNIDNKKEIQYVIIEKDTLTFTYYSNQNKLENGYFILLKEGKYCLLGKKRVQFIKETTPHPYSEKKPDRFINKSDEYFLKHQDDIARKLNNKSSLKKIFTDKHNVLEFIKKEKISANNVEKLILLVRYLNKNRS